MYNYEKLYKQYLYKKDQLIFTKERVAEMITSKFKAREFSKTKILDLVNDDHFEYNKIYKCFVIDDPSILIQLFSNEEKKNHREEILDNREHPLNPKRVKEWEYNHLLLDEQEGRRIDIILESKDGLYISESQVRASCEKLDRYLNALIVGAIIENELEEYPVDIHNEYFQFYLENLDQFGFLN
ncbi:hypothetical protein KQI25_02985 [Bacillus pumilus]|uniref:hypothetical protein n=1 Tax=Bacillus TaxID=1386 RepID=UPI000D02E611|nr:MULTISPECIES: hypothetical protein [Bacillus]AZV54585.1 hypothetical protein DKE43_16500 [Bacillus pumilus]MBR0621959.1 hypothetical protein [Bacillus pumilus]MBU5258189.1 hypothetical protein [Bacillus pumilus]MCK6165162.1 hypothetical protein [Bacillus pumilus]MCK6185668.1 hypothetical protein [Bacillus pumilus]